MGSDMHTLGTIYGVSFQSNFEDSPVIYVPQNWKRLYKESCGFDPPKRYAELAHIIAGSRPAEYMLCKPFREINPKELINTETGAMEYGLGRFFSLNPESGEALYGAGPEDFPHDYLVAFARDPSDGVWAFDYRTDLVNPKVVYFEYYYDEDIVYPTAPGLIETDMDLDDFLRSLIPYTAVYL